MLISCRSWLAGLRTLVEFEPAKDRIGDAALEHAPRLLRTV